MFMAFLAIAGPLLQPEVTQTVVDHAGSPVAEYPLDVATTLRAACPQGRVRFSFRNFPENDHPRIERLSVGSTIYSRSQLALLESLFSGLRVESSGITYCSRQEDHRIVIFVRFALAANTAGEMQNLAVIYVDQRGISIPPRDFERIRAAAVAVGRPPDTDRRH